MPENKDTIAFWGYPHPDLIAQTKKLYPNAKWVDLDVDFGFKDLKIAPEAHCGIIKNIYNNALHLKDKIITILAPIGKDKCDSAFFAANLLEKEGLNVQMCAFEDVTPLEKLPQLHLCTSDLPLKEKVEKITANIVEQKDYSHLVKSEARFGFWGVPPNDLTLLELFPNNTHVFGWCRCVEAKNPANIQLEMYVDENLPTVFFAQTFCAKNILAKHLAKKYNGLYIDVDGTPSNSIRSKVEAFLRLR